MAIEVEPFSQKAFEPFGVVADPPGGQSRVYLIRALENLRPGAGLAFSTASWLPERLPYFARVMERHRYSSQTIRPLDVYRHLVLVAPDLGGGMPDMHSAKAFVVPGCIGITHAANVWHHPMLVLRRPGSFSVLLWRDHSPNDIEDVELSSPVAIVGGTSGPGEDLPLAERPNPRASANR